MEKLNTLTIAHRGASGLVEYENTLDAFEKAIEINCDAIECDIRKTKDDILIINHNEDINNMLIKDYTYNELLSFAPYHIATLEETLKLVKGKILIDIEIKELGYEEKIVNEILSILDINEFYIRSFYDEALIKIHSLNKDIKLILLTGVVNPTHLLKTRYSEVFPKRRLKKCGAFAVSPYYKELILGYPKRLKRQGYNIIVWTVNEKEDMEKLIGKVDGIITNYPNILKELLEKNN